MRKQASVREFSGGRPRGAGQNRVHSRFDYGTPPLQRNRDNVSEDIYRVGYGRSAAVRLARYKPMESIVFETVVDGHNDRLGLWVFSDVHAGSPNSDIERWRRDMDEAMARGDWLMCIGDFFDCILPTDHRRYTQSGLIPRLRDRDDITSELMDYGVELMSPYAERLILWGAGNHEKEMLHHHHADIINLCLGRLNEQLKNKKGKTKHKISHGGYSGYLQIAARRKKNNGKDRTTGKRKSWKIHYHHGSGGESPVTKGMINANRSRISFVADTYLFGHHHHRWADDCRIIDVTPQGKIIAHESKIVQTGGYLRAYGKEAEPGRHLEIGYEEYRKMLPKPQGGARVTAWWEGASSERLRQRVEI